MPENVQVLAIKRAENSPGATIIRLQERSGAATRAALRSTALGLDQPVTLRPWELKTVIVERHGGGKTELREITSIET
jgi:alpha-mannosidase